MNPMKTIKVKVPDHKLDFFMELMDQLHIKAVVKEVKLKSEKEVLKEIEAEFKKMRKIHQN